MHIMDLKEKSGRSSNAREAEGASRCFRNRIKRLSHLLQNLASLQAVLEDDTLWFTRLVRLG